MTSPSTKIEKTRQSSYAVPLSYSCPTYGGEEERLDEGMYLVTVGLPGRGKTFVANKLCRYLSWIGVKSKCFLVSDYLRLNYADESVGEKKFLHNYYKEENQTARRERKEALRMALKDANEFLHGGSGVAIIDSQATDRNIRLEIEQHAETTNCKITFVELIMLDSYVEELFTLKHSLMHSHSHNEYSHLDSRQAFTDFQQRINHLRENYTSIDGPTTTSYISIAPRGTSFKGIHGYVPCKILSWLPNLSALNRMRFPIYFARHGESMFNLQNRIGGDPELSEKGRGDAKLICDYVRTLGLDNKLEVWTSYLKRTIETAAGLLQNSGNVYKHRKYSALNEIYAGICENLTYDELRESHPDINKWRSEDKFAYRYPSGESYQDLVLRIEPVIMDLEAAECPVLVVSHQAVLRTLFAYFSDIDVKGTPDMVIPQGTIWEYTPTATGMGKLTQHTLRDAKTIET